jgi:hypothetical protein
MKTTANIATYPKRFPLLLNMLESIRGQFDEVRIYLNEYKEVPEELKEYTTHIGKNLTDNGKFFWSTNKNEYYFTLDDDIIYPPDYVKKTLPQIKDRIVTYHGRKLKGLNRSYYRKHEVFHCTRVQHYPQIVDVGGTGVMAFNTNKIHIDIADSLPRKMTDILVGLTAAMNKYPIVCLTKTSMWISCQQEVDRGIYDFFVMDDSVQTKLSDAIQLLKGFQ